MSIFNIGIVGGIILILGAAWKSGKDINQPLKSIKNRLFLLGNIIMFIFSWLGYQEGGSIFFVILEIFIMISSILMMTTIKNKYKVFTLGITGLLLIVYSLMLFDGYSKIIFVIGLSILGIGYALQMGNIFRDYALTIGSIILTIFSFIEYNLVFILLNGFFTIFAGYYLIQNIKKNGIGFKLNIK